MPAFSLPWPVGLYPTPAISDLYSRSLPPRPAPVKPRVEFLQETRGLDDSGTGSDPGLSEPPGRLLRRGLVDMDTADLGQVARGRNDLDMPVVVVGEGR